ncbi:Peptidyl-Lys metalloendopeptidase [Grifola frondosa]|uniref:Peptidyl-Lys metalloendopeptidase n=1 Tax=Grifola frondosa TaxID=5627 RepID=A0A1C7MSB4_GRIFR|nr:Peptidyl-Lys metalloendopeptidase [Grifola frondosa]
MRLEPACYRHCSASCVPFGLLGCSCVPPSSPSSPPSWRSPPPRVVLQITGPTSIHDVQNLKVVTTVVNSGDETLKLLNVPESVLSRVPTDLFAIANRYGESPVFVGAKYIPSLAIESKDASAFTVLYPGEFVEVEHNLSEAYDFSSTGPGVYDVKLREHNSVHYFDPSKDELVQMRTYATHRVSISGTLSGFSHSYNVPSFSGCSAVQESEIVGVLPTAQRHVSYALKYILFTFALRILSSAAFAMYSEVRRDTLGTSALYKQWFGTPNSMHRDLVLQHFGKLATHNFQSYDYVCMANDLCEPGLIAVGEPQQVGMTTFFGTINLCPKFFTLSITGRNSKPSVIIHEAIHFEKNGGIDDYAYDVYPSMRLASTTPKEAVMNADSYEYFAADSTFDLQAVLEEFLAQVHFVEDRASSRLSRLLDELRVLEMARELRPIHVLESLKRLVVDGSRLRHDIERRIVDVPHHLLHALERLVVDSPHIRHDLERLIVDSPHLLKDLERLLVESPHLLRDVECRALDTPRLCHDVESL